MTIGQGNFPLDDLTYDMVTLLYEKSKGLQAYDKYLQDAQSSPPCTQLLQQLRQQDEDAVRQLQDHVKQLLNGTMGNGSTHNMDMAVGGGSMGSTSTMGSLDVNTLRGIGTSDTDLGSTRSGM